MNATQEKIIRGVISNYKDDLHRYRLQQLSDPKWVTGNGESPESVVAHLESLIKALEEGLS